MSPFVVFLRTDTILMHTLSLHRRPPPSADGSGLFQDICQWLYKLGYTFFFFVCNIYVYLYVFKNTQFKCICLVDWLNIVLYCFLLFFCTQNYILCICYYTYEYHCFVDIFIHIFFQRPAVPLPDAVSLFYM